MLRALIGWTTEVRELGSASARCRLKRQRCAQVA
jgi:hypothetical protein